MGGRITSVVKENQQLVALVDFIYQTLPVWRDDPERPNADRETDLNETLYIMLANKAKRKLPLFLFTPEARASGQRRIDMAVMPSEKIALAARTYTKYETVLAIECKRLPAPTRDREREYVSGGDKTTGGIQRFKLSEHGAGLPVAVMVGYIQRETAQIWLEKINGWLVEMAGSKTGDGLLWESGEKLGDFRYDGEAATACAISSHPRISGTPRLHEQPIKIRHLWVEMSRRGAVPIS